MTILERLYASSGSEVIHDTLQISAGDDNYWLTSGWDDVSVTLENGQPATFEACAIEIALPARNADGTQDEMKSATLTFRRYISSDLSAPASSPYTLDIKSGSWTPTAVQVTAGYMNILKTAWPRKRYNLAEHPGLRY